MSSCKVITLGDVDYQCYVGIAVVIMNASNFHSLGHVGGYGDSVSFRLGTLPAHSCIMEPLQTGLDKSIRTIFCWVKKCICCQ